MTPREGRKCPGARRKSNEDEEQWLQGMDDMLETHVEKTESTLSMSAEALRMASKAVRLAGEAREGLAVMRERMYA
jgi:hypothetical protein